jgi:hypothetical protein
MVHQVRILPILVALPSDDASAKMRSQDVSDDSHENNRIRH